MTDANGSAQFTTIYPGWYPGRTVHIHFRVRSTATSGETYDFISQLFFPDSVTDQVYTQSPYSSRPNRNTRNSQDSIYNSGGSQLLLSLVQTSQGYTATMDIGLSLSVTHNAPLNISLAPTSGSSAPGVYTTLTTRQSDLDGISDLTTAGIQFTDTTGKLRALYRRSVNKLYLLNDAGTAYIGGYAPGSANVISNSRGRLNCAHTTVSTEGTDTLVVRWRIAFRSPLAGTTQKVWLYVRDKDGLKDGYERFGTWSVTSSTTASDTE